MSNDANDDGTPPLGDGSHLVDELPRPSTSVSVMPLAVTGPSTGPDGEPQTAEQLAVVPAQVIQTLSGKEQVAALQRTLEPCPNCRFFCFPQQGTKDHAEVHAYVSALYASLPDWQLKAVPGRNPSEWGVCQGSPSGLRACVHFANHCEHFRKA